MIYKVLIQFDERFDGNRCYKAGDAYPADGFVPPNGRAEALVKGGQSALNETGLKYLAPVRKEPDENAQPPEVRAEPDARRGRPPRRNAD